TTDEKVPYLGVFGRYARKGRLGELQQRCADAPGDALGTFYRTRPGITIDRPHVFPSARREENLHLSSGRNSRNTSSSSSNSPRSACASPSSIAARSSSEST